MLTPTDRQLIYDLRELVLLLSVDPVMPEDRPITAYFVYQQRKEFELAVNRAIERILIANGVNPIDK